MIPKAHRIKIGDVTRLLPVRCVDPKSGLHVAYFNLQCDIAVTEEAGRLLACLAHDLGNDAFVMPEGKATPLLQQIGRYSGRAIVVAHKSSRPVMLEPIVSVEYKSITTGKTQTLCFDTDEIRALRGKKVVIVDDVISTGGSVEAMKALLKKVGATIVGVMCVFTEGDRRDDVIALGHLPLFKD